ncbi:MAG: hypothetical protein AB7U05_09105 [Mangrovibacterium sp.]
MIILKRPDNLIFDTENPATKVLYIHDGRLCTPLHWIINQTVCDFLLEHYKPTGDIEHPIFQNFENSYFSVFLDLENLKFKPAYSYTAHHVPTGEDWYLIGIDTKQNRACAAGWPPSIGKLTDFISFAENKPLTPDEINYRNKTFGTTWL